MFKVGDRVVNPKWAKRDGIKEYSGTIMEVLKNNKVYIRADEGSDWPDEVKNLVLEEVYNSPLFKVLYEDE